MEQFYMLTILPMPANTLATLEAWYWPQSRNIRPQRKKS